MTRHLDRLEIAAAEDPYYNYCWWKYEPVAPTAGKFRCVDLLYHSFDVAGVSDRAYDTVDLIRQAIGPHRSVWGTKLIDGRLGWEYYFYDYQRVERDVSVSRVMDAVRPVVPCPVRVDENLPYFMFSVDILPDVLDGRRALDEIHLYIGNPGSTVSSGIAYSVTPGGTRLENFYFFFDAKRDLKEAMAKVRCSAHVDPDAVDIDQILWPELRDCRTLCIANKQRNDTAYFSGVTVDQLLFFLKAMKYPPEIVGFVEQNRGRLDHILYDVGIDYVGQGDEIRVVKSGYYGYF